MLWLCESVCNQCGSDIEIGNVRSTLFVRLSVCHWKGNINAYSIGTRSVVYVPESVCTRSMWAALCLFAGI
jgi:hypothetical protein